MHSDYKGIHTLYFFSLADKQQRQREQLQILRKKFEDDAWRRFMTQYVTSKVVEAEYRDREEYGLPNELTEPKSRTFHAQMKRNLTPKTRQKANKRKFGYMFNYNAGPEWKTGGKPMKFEGFDTVYLDSEDDQGTSAFLGYLYLIWFY